MIFCTKKGSACCFCISWTLPPETQAVGREDLGLGGTERGDRWDWVVPPSQLWADKLTFVGDDLFSWLVTLEIHETYIINVGFIASFPMTLNQPGFWDGDTG